jgi:hypothetical protein
LTAGQAEREDDSFLASDYLAPPSGRQTVWSCRKLHRERPGRMENKARRVADRRSATGGQARDGLSAGLSSLTRRPKSRSWR